MNKIYIDKLVKNKNKSFKKGRGAGGSVADALNDMMGGSSEKGAVKVDIVMMMDAHCDEGYHCDDGYYSEGGRKL